MSGPKIMKAGDLFFLTHQGIESASTVQVTAPDGTRFYENGFRHGFHRQPTVEDPFLLIRDYEWLVVHSAASPDAYEKGKTTAIPAVLFEVLFEDKATAFVIFISKGRVLEDMVVPAPKDWRYETR